MRVLFFIALRNLLQARRRTTMLSAAIALVTMLLVLLLAMSAGINDNLIRGATTLSAGHINVSGFFKASRGEAAPIIDGVARIREIVQKNTPNLAYITDRHRGWGKVVSATGSIQSGLSGVDLAQEVHFLDRLQLAQESEYKEGGSDQVFGDPTRLSDPHTTMLFASQAKKLKVGVGDPVTLQVEMFGGRTNTSDVTVVAIARDVGLLSTFTVFLPKSEILELYQLDADTSGAVWVYLDDINDAEATMAHLREVFAKEGYEIMDHEPAPFFMKFETVQGEDWTGQKLDLTIWRDEVSFLTWVITAFDTVTGFLVLVLVFIIAIGIMNTMWNAVRERTREIGTMRAIGMHRRKVLGLFLFEALLLGVFATTLGACAGAAVALVVDAAQIRIPVQAAQFILLSDTLHLLVRPQAFFASVASISCFVVLASLWPALRASRLPPVTALGHTQ